MSIQFNYQNAGLRAHELEYARPLAEAAFCAVEDRCGPGHEMLGWLDLPHTGSVVVPDLEMTLMEKS